ncbi:MAG: hypothetical protein V7739_16430 [Motiliproteus sp.]
MISFEEFRKNVVPAFNESEKAYFIRISAEYKQLQKMEARQQRKQQWANRLTSVANLVIIEPNLLRIKSA